MSVSKIFEIPKYYYFQSGNDYSGSKGDFNYKIITSEKIKCLTWHGKFCSMKSEIENEKDFENSENGFSELISWLEQRFQE